LPARGTLTGSVQKIPVYGRKSNRRGLKVKKDENEKERERVVKKVKDLQR
jgi:hypothetical protein